MIFTSLKLSYSSFLLSASGLFDFDLTFPGEGLLFLFLSLIVTNVFLSPISKQMEERSQFLDYHFRKSMILLDFAHETLSQCLGLLTEEIQELNRQVKEVRKKSAQEVESHIQTLQNENVKLLRQLKGSLTLQSAYVLFTMKKELATVTDQFLERKFTSSK
jgi:hypothetical protein